MRKTFITRPSQLLMAVAALSVLSFCLPVAAQQPPPKKTADNNAVPDLGKVVGSTYTNKYFGLQFTIPEGWRVADDDATRRINEQGAELVAGDSDEKRERLKAAANKTLNLLTVGKMLPAAGGASESVILIVGAEAVPSWLVKTPQEYLGQARRLLQSSAMKMNVAEGTRNETIGGVEFAVLDVSSEQPGGVVRQHYYVTLKRGYALFFISTFASERSAQAIGEVLKTVTFK